MSESPTLRGSDDLDDRFADAKPTQGVVHRHMRGRLKQKLFGVEQDPTRVGRFVIIERLGQGGMGVVYSAYDPELDRRVALKLVKPRRTRSSSQAKQRLLREAQALARLSHPNVVPVYDVGVIDDQIFIVMEFVVGHTLSDWIRADERTWREIVAAYRQAGEGLAAAHAVGLVHRDFKPNNVLIGRDGRIRVLDFGLARGSPDSGEFLPDARPTGTDDGESTSASTSASFNRLEIPLTASGEILGTPGYMSPEQYANDAVGPESDQFSFCVSLYEGLYGQRPFDGPNQEELSISTQDGAVRAPPRSSGVPGWLSPVLSRGLKPDPADRYPSMDALLAALARDPARTRRRWLLAGLLVSSLVVSGFALATSGTSEPDPCHGAERELVGVWDPDRRAVVEAALMATERAYAHRAWPRVAAGLDRYARDWVAMHEDACLSHRRGAHSSDMLDKRMACLERRLTALGSAVSVLAETDRESLAHTVEVMRDLPSIEYCANVEALAAEVPPPEDPDIARRVVELDEQLSLVKAFEDAGRYRRAIELVDRLVREGQHLNDRPFLAEALLVQGRIIEASGDRLGAIKPLERAAALGIAMGRNDVGVEAIARLIYVEGTWNGSQRDPLDSLYIAEALLEQTRDPFVRALLLNNIGVLHMARSQPERARAYLEKARQMKAHARHLDRIELAVVEYNLGLVTPDPDERVALMTGAVTELERELGPIHPRSIEMRLWALTYVSDPISARASLVTTCGDLARYHPDLLDSRSTCHYELGFQYAELGDPGQASSHLLEAARLLPGDAANDLRQFARGYGLLYAGELDAALTALETALSLSPTAPEQWWEHKSVAEIKLARAEVLMARGQVAEAQVILEHVLPVFIRLAEQTHKVEIPRRLARTRVALATTLSSSANDRARALIDQAEAWYRSAGQGYRQRLQTLRAWRDVHGGSR